jgi:hypothetical protein
MAQILDQVTNSTLSLQGQTPNIPANALPSSTNQTVKGLEKSLLDLPLANPEKYLDKKPQ